MELIVIPNGSGKYIVNDEKNRKIYSVSKKRKLIGNPITTLHDASGYALYAMVRTATGKKPSFDITLNDALFLTAQCKSLYVDPCITFNGSGGDYELKGRNAQKMGMYKNGEMIGEIRTEQQLSNELKYLLSVENKEFDDFLPLFAVVADKCFGTK